MKLLFKKPIALTITNYKTKESCTLSSLESENVASIDIETITNICNEAKIYSLLFSKRLNGQPYPSKEAESFIDWANKGWKESTHFVFIVRNAENSIIAAVDIKSNNPEAEIGYWCSEAGSGVMTNSVLAVASIAREAGFSELYAMTLPENQQSENVLIRAGFQRFGLIEEEGITYFRYDLKLIM